MIGIAVVLQHVVVGGDGVAFAGLPDEAIEAGLGESLLEWFHDVVYEVADEVLVFGCVWAT